MTPTPVVIVGAGAIGAATARLLLADGRPVVTVDAATSPVQAGDREAPALVADATAPPPPPVAAALAAADVVVLALPEKPLLAALQHVLSAAPTGALVVETASVQTPVAAALAALPDGPAVVGVNPMFAPSLAPAGRPVAVVPLRGTPTAAEQVETFLRRHAMVPTRLDATAHDEVCAITQALPHAAVLAVGRALAEFAPDPALLDRLAPPPMRLLLALVARVAGGTPAVYHDIQTAEPGAAAARSALANGLHGLADAVADPAAFAAVMARGATALGDDLPLWRERCAAVFAELPRLEGRTR